MLHILQAVLIAQATAAADPPKWMQLAPFALMLVVVYFLMLAPGVEAVEDSADDALGARRKTMRSSRQAVSMGASCRSPTKIVTLEIAKDTRIKLLRSAIAGKWNPDTEKTPEATKAN